MAALAGVGFKCRAGEIVGVLGLNGAGKSTLLCILAGELLPTSDRVRVAGVELGASSQARSMCARPFGRLGGPSTVCRSR